jgi:hypothetical protein
MKYSVLAFLLAFPLFLLAQTADTTVVQTFTWDSDVRTGSFSFPAEPADHWRKIYLVYNMRCHNAAIGGCGEWDYSCNTFVTDPSRIDSTRQTHPDYVISGFTGTQFAYAAGPTYTYYQFEQHQTAIGSGMPVEATVGSGLAGLDLANGTAARKLQLLFTAAELAAAGVVAGPVHGLRVEALPPGGAADFFKIRLKPTAKTALAPEEVDLAGFTEVYFNAVATAAGAVELVFYQPFVWDGTSNLLVELSYHGATAPAVRAHDAGFAAALSSAATSDHALNFGSGSFVDVEAAPLQDLAAEVTVAFWSYGNSAVLPANSTAFEGVDAANRRTLNVHLPWSDGRVYWDAGSNGGYDRIDKAADAADFEGRWTHWAFTKNTTTGSMKIYRDGVLWHSGTGKTQPVDLAALRIGGAYDGSLSYFGRIDEFQVWAKELDAATIAAWMRRAVTPDHPDYASLRAWYRFDEGAGTLTLDASAQAAVSTVNLPHWIRTRAEDLYKDFEAGTVRPNTTFVQGDLTVTDQPVALLDSVQNAQQRVVHFGLAGTDLVALDTSYFFPAGPMPVFDAVTGETIDTIAIAAAGTIGIQPLVYYVKRPARFELLSLVTPYGNGLNLGAEGRTFTFDVSDFAPVLRGAKTLSIEYGGEWQEELDLKFVFVAGTPARPVLDVQNVWPAGRAWYQELLDDRYYEPRTLTLHPAGDRFKLRSAITGHGQNGEFVPRQHYLDVDGGAQEFTYDVWKYCGKNPIYPQGGTWVFDRAGWCPGMATDVREFALAAGPGQTIELDYGVNGAFLSDANYLVSNQLVSYGAPSHTLDVSVEGIIRPNNRQVEYARINPACAAPIVTVRNNGSTTVTSLAIQYWVPGGGALDYTWHGTLASDAAAPIELPMPSPSFWSTADPAPVFHVAIEAVNGGNDGEPANDAATMPFTPAPVYDYADPLRLRVATNNTGADYSYTIKDAAGAVVMSRNQMASNTTYTDILDLPDGCYTLDFVDAGNDGLSFWYFPQNGNGSLRLMRLVNNTLVPLRVFNSDFGGGVQFDFVIGQVVGTAEKEQARLLTVYPNPATDAATLELRGFGGEKLAVRLLDVHGRAVYSAQVRVGHDEAVTEKLPLHGLPAGLYMVQVASAQRVWVSEVVKR